MARLALLLVACAAVANGDDAAGKAVAVATDSADATGAGAEARGAAAATPDWLASRSQRRFLINGDTWHRVADAAADEASRPEAKQHRQAFYYYNERTRATAWELPRHTPRGQPLWATRGADGREHYPLGPPLLDFSALSFPDSASDFVTIALPAAMLVAAKHAGGAWRAAKRGATNLRDAAAARGVRCPVGAAPKAD